MKKFIRNIALALVVAFSLGNVNPVFASTKDDELKSEMTVEQAIKIIEDNYLTLKDDGTFEIDSKAKKIIPEDIYKSLENGVKGTNTEIIEKKLEVSENFQGYVVKPVEDFNSRVSTYAAPIINNYTFFWWGHIAEMNTEATQILINNMDYLVYIFGATGVATGQFTLGAGVVLSIAGGVFAFSLATQARNALVITPNGATYYAYGGTENGQIYKVTQLYN